PHRLYSIRAMATGDPASIRIQRRIDWSDTDASGAYHNTAAFRLMEAAETSLVDRLGFLEDVYGRHPRVRLEADFLRPLFFRDLVDVTLRVTDVGGLRHRDRPGWRDVRAGEARGGVPGPGRGDAPAVARRVP